MTDDRMDRAERIRNMREGSRGTDDANDDATDGEETGSASPDDATDGESAGSETADYATSAAASESDGIGDRDASADDAGFSPLTTGDDDAASEAATAAAEAAEAVDSARGVDAATASDATDDTASASDAQAAARRAAESAAQVTGTVDGGAESGAGAEVPADSTTTTDAAGGDGPAVPAGATGASTVPGDISGVEIPDQQLLEEAMATSSVETTEGGARAAMEGDATQSEEVVRVLEFSLGEEYYCLDIEYVEEIVKRETVTRVPNTPDFVDGVVDLRGQITTILEPKEMMDIDSEGQQDLIIVFDPEQFEDQGAIGWVVDEVRQVVPVPESDINHPPVDAEYINGVVDREGYDQFVIWVEPEDALAQATATEEE